jgi:hypothetical protein
MPQAEQATKLLFLLRTLKYFRLIELQNLLVRQQSDEDDDDDDDDAV